MERRCDTGRFKCRENQGLAARQRILKIGARILCVCARNPTFRFRVLMERAVHLANNH